MTSTGRSFTVDLRGIVDLLSHHLYSSPRVYVRELLQNATDALTARESLHPGFGGRVVLVPADRSDDGAVHCLDNGVGLTADEVTRFLATIGSSSKRDDLGFARSEFLGQFGIGLLSCFLISDRITLVSRSARESGGGRTVVWTGSSDGTYDLREPDEAEAERLWASAPVPVDGGAPGTWVTLHPRPGDLEWTGERQVTALAEEFGQMLRHRVEVAAGRGPTRRITAEHRPWEGGEPADQRTVNASRLLGVPVLALVPLHVAEAGVRGYAAVLARTTSPASSQAHRVYAKGMLVGAQVDRVLPDWAFFARCVIDADNLRLTASREALYEDDLLESVRTSLGGQIRTWLLRTAEVDPATFERFLDLHGLAVKALATHDDELLRLMLPWLAFETSAGRLTLPEVAERFGVVRYTATVAEFRQIAPVAAAEGLGVVNAGYTYDVELLAAVRRVQPELDVQLLAPGDLGAHVADVPNEVAVALGDFVRRAARSLESVDVRVELRRFEPVTLPALVLDDRESWHRRSSRSVAAEADETWAALLRVLDDGADDRPRLLLNHANPTIRRVASIEDERLQALAVESLYCQALLAGQHPLRPQDAALLSRSFVGLLDAAVAARSPHHPDEEDDR